MLIGVGEPRTGVPVHIDEVRVDVCFVQTLLLLFSQYDDDWWVYLTHIKVKYREKSWTITKRS